MLTMTADRQVYRQMVRHPCRRNQKAYASTASTVFRRLNRLLRWQSQVTMQHDDPRVRRPALARLIHVDDAAISHPSFLFFPSTSILFTISSPLPFPLFYTFALPSTFPFPPPLLHFITPTVSLSLFIAIPPPSDSPFLFLFPPLLLLSPTHTSNPMDLMPLASPSWLGASLRGWHPAAP